MTDIKLKAGDIVIPNWFPNTDEITCVSDMELCFGKQYPIQRIDSADEDIYYVADWTWPKYALTLAK